MSGPKTYASNTHVQVSFFFVVLAIYLMAFGVAEKFEKLEGRVAVLESQLRATPATTPTP